MDRARAEDSIWFCAPVLPIGPAEAVPQRKFFPQALAVSVCLAFLACACLALPARAVGLGEIEVRSHLGEALDAVIPVTGVDAEALQDDCFAVVPPSQEGVPAIEKAAFSMVHDAGQLALRVRTPTRLHEPALMLAIRAACPGARGTLRREYAVLLDPVRLEATPLVTQAIPSAAPGLAVVSSAPRESMVPSPRAAESAQAHRGRAISHSGRAHSRPVHAKRARHALAERSAAHTADGGFVLKLSGPELDIANLQRSDPADRAALRERLLQLDADDGMATILAMRERVRQLESQVSSLQLQISRLAASAPAASAPAASVPATPAPAASAPAAVAATSVATTPAMAPPIAAPRPRTPRAEATSRASPSITTHASRMPRWVWLALAALLAAAAAGLAWRLRKRDAQSEFSWSADPEPQPAPEFEIAIPIQQVKAPEVKAQPVAELPAHELPPVANEESLEFAPAGPLYEAPLPAHAAASNEASLDGIDDSEAAIRAARLFYEDGALLRASQLLQAAIERHPDERRPWLALLELLRREGLTADHADLAARFRQVHGDGVEWRKVQYFGRELDPDNALYRDETDAPIEFDALAENWLDMPASFDDALAAELRRALVREASRPRTDSENPIPG